MIDGDLARIYVDLWKNGPANARRETVVEYYLLGFCRHLLGVEAGVFMTHDGERDPDLPVIWILREVVPDDDACFEPDLSGADLNELLTLAHERGHERSFWDGTYQLGGGLAEEERAWDHAADLLRGLGFTEWPAFHENRATSLRLHRENGALARPQ